MEDISHRWSHVLPRLIIVIAALVGFGFFGLAQASTASALTTVPTKMNFQGRLADSAGNIKPNGIYNMRLKLFTVSSGGSNVWSEDRLVSATQGVTVTNGQFSIQLGEITTLPASLFASGPLYLEVELPTPATATSSSPTWTEGAMTPRNQMATSAYAYNSETLDGLDSVSFGQLSANNTFTGTSLFRNTSDSTAAFDIQNAASQSLFGVGTSNQKVTLGTAPSADSFTKIADPATLPAGAAARTAWSPDGVYLSVSHTTSPYVTIYKRAGDTLTKLSNPATLPTGNGTGTSWSPDGVYLSVTHQSSPYVTIYKRSGDTFTKLTNPATLPATDAYGTAWSPDGKYMTVAHDSSPFITIYKRSGDTFTKLTNPATLPAGNARATAFSPNGQYMTVGHATTPFITIYKRSGDTFTKLTNPATLPNNSGQAVAFSPDNLYMSVANTGSSPFTTIYKRSDDTFTKLANPSQLSTGLGYGTSWSPDGQYLAGGHANSPYVYVYKTGGQKIVNDIQGSVTVSNNLSANNLIVTHGLTTADFITNSLQASGPAEFKDSVNITAAVAPIADMLKVENTGHAVVTNNVNGIGINYVGGAAAVEGAGVRVDLTPGTTTGGTWSGLRVVSAATGPVTGVTSYGIKLEGPSSPGAGQETGMYIGTDWDTGLDVQSGGLNLAGYTSGGNPADPAAPAADNLRVYAKKVAGRMMLKWKAPSGVDTTLQPSLGSNTIYLWTPATGTTAIGTGFGNTWPAVTGTITHPTVANTNIGTSIKAMQSTNVVTTTNQILGLTASSATLANVYRGNAAGRGGFFMNTRFKTNLVPAATIRLFVGLTSMTTGASAADTVTGDTAGLSHITTDSGTTMAFMTRDNTTTTRATFTVPTIAAGNAYDFTMYSAPNGSEIYYRLVDLLDGSVLVDSSTSTTLPRNTIFMGPQVQMSNGTANITVTTTAIGINKMYLETDN